MYNLEDSEKLDTWKNNVIKIARYLFQNNLDTNTFYIIEKYFYDKISIYNE